MFYNSDFRMKKNKVPFLVFIMLIVTTSSCSIDSEVYSPGDFLDCNHEENFFSAKFNGKIVFNSFD